MTPACMPLLCLLLVTHIPWPPTHTRTNCIPACVPGSTQGPPLSTAHHGHLSSGAMQLRGDAALEAALAAVAQELPATAPPPPGGAVGGPAGAGAGAWKEWQRPGTTSAPHPTVAVSPLPSPGDPHKEHGKPASHLGMRPFNWCFTCQVVTVSSVCCLKVCLVMLQPKSRWGYEHTGLVLMCCLCVPMCCPESGSSRSMSGGVEESPRSVAVVAASHVFPRSAVVHSAHA
jgi:hypothetical protein